MYLYRKDPERDMTKIAEQLRRASGIKEGSEHCPHGFSGIVSFSFGDIYVDDNLNKLLSETVKEEIDGCLEQMSREDYGMIDAEEEDVNIENKYLGNGKGLLGRYSISEGIIEIAIELKYTMVSLINDEEQEKRK